MAYSISHNNGATVTTPYTFGVRDNSKVDYTVIGEGAKPASTTLSNLNSGVSTPEVTMLQSSRVPNIYLNSEVEKVLQAPSKTGIKLYHSIKQTWSYADATGNLPSYDKPVSGSITLTIPNDGVVTVTDVLEFISDLVGSFVWGSTTRLDRELRGSTNPLHD